MPMMLWRCVNEECDQTGFEFESEENRCPHCKLCRCQDLVYVHYIVPAEGPIKTGLGNRMIACDPNRKTLPQSTGERVAVSCPKCKATDIFKEDERDKVSNDVPLFLQQIVNGK